MAEDKPKYKPKLSDVISKDESKTPTPKKAPSAPAPTPKKAPPAPAPTPKVVKRVKAQKPDSY